MQTLLDVIVPVFIVIGFGYVAVWRGLFSESAVDGLMKFTQSFAIPCLLFQAIAKIDLSASFDVALLASFYTGAVACFFLGFAGARTFFARPWEDCVAIGFCCLFSNSVLLGLPIAERAYGTEALTGNFAIIAIHSPVCYGLGITAMEIVRNRGQAPVKMVRAIFGAMFRNALVLAIALGFIVNLTNLTIPGVVDEALSLIVRAALPVALFALGGILFQYRPEGDGRTIAMVCGVTLIIHPAIVWGMAKFTGLPTDAFRSAVLTAAMAPGVNTYIFANIYGRAKRVAASSVLITTGLSLFSVWMWLTLLETV